MKIGFGLDEEAKKNPGFADFLVLTYLIFFYLIVSGIYARTSDYLGV